MKVMLEHDYLNSPSSGPNSQPLTSNYNFSDPRMKELNEYSTQLIREVIIPKLTKEVNSSKRYAALRQVFFSLVMARWFKDTFQGKPGQYAQLIDSHNLNNLTSKEAWSKTYYFNEYKKSFEQGEYNLKENIYTPTGQAIRSYVSGGLNLMPKTPSPLFGGFKSGVKKVLFTGLFLSGLGLVSLPGLEIDDTVAGPTKKSTDGTELNIVREDNGMGDFLKRSRPQYVLKGAAEEYFHRFPYKGEEALSTIRPQGQRRYEIIMEWGEALRKQAKIVLSGATILEMQPIGVTTATQEEIKELFNAFKKIP